MKPLNYSSEQVLDEDVIAELESLGGEDDGRGLIDSLFEVFEETAVETIQRARRGAEAKVMVDFAESVHKLKGSSGSMGALALFNCCKEVDKYVKAKVLEADDLAPLVDTIAAEYERARIAFLEHLGRAEI